MKLLENKNIIVTGGGQGIGKAICLVLADHGANVIVSDINEKTAQQTAKEVLAKGHVSIAVKCDVTKASEVKLLMKTAIRELKNIDVLINNAGINIESMLVDIKEEDWDAVIDINLKSVFLCSKEIAKYMIKARQGRIINIASIFGQIGGIGLVNYGASKGGVISLTRSLAKELIKDNILVNAVAPGFIKTPMTDKLSDIEKEKLIKLIPFGKMGDPSDVANAVIYLSSYLSSYVIGQVITVDGGITM